MSTTRPLEPMAEELCGDLAHIRAPRGTELHARAWATEAPLRMLLNNLDPDVAERPEELVVYGGSGNAARNPEALRARVRSPVGLGGMGGAQPLAGTMAGAAILCVEVDPSRIERRIETRYLDEATESIDDALARIRAAASEGRALSVGLLGNAAEAVPELARRGEHFDLVTDQTAAHDPLTGYIPYGLSVDEAAVLRSADPDEYRARARSSIARHVQGLFEYVRAGSYVFDYGNNLRGEAREAGVAEAFSYPGFVPAYIRPLFCRGIGPFRWAALSGDAADIAAIDAVLRDLFPDDPLLQRWLELAPERVAFQGLPARICWLGLGDRARAGLAINELVRSGDVKAPVVIGRDHLDSGSVASPYRETEAMRDGSDAIADWPILNALLNVAAGATWVSVHHGGGVGIGNSIHAGLVVVADGTAEMAERLERVLTTDPGMGVLRHFDAGYDEAIEAARSHGLEPPMAAGGG